MHFSTTLLLLSATVGLAVGHRCASCPPKIHEAYKTYNLVPASEETNSDITFCGYEGPKKGDEGFCSYKLDKNKPEAKLLGTTFKKVSGQGQRSDVQVMCGEDRQIFH
ncbi:hypothetical protein C8J57DRAFT_1458187 [Mycena rebaudengoi]|nr:hypothetical protein C8J57DRAFT_1458187 [Mycena rebaudengoi]